MPRPTLRDALSTVSMEYFPDIEVRRDVIATLIEEHGTPLFVCDSDIVRDRIETLDEALTAAWGKHAIAYSFKTSYPLARSRVLPDNGVWAEVVSGREYSLARELGYPGNRIVFNGPLKTDAELTRSLEDGALVNINDGDELERVIALASAAGTAFDVGLRISSQRLGLRRPTRFGLCLDDGSARTAVQRIHDTEHLTLCGLHLHLQGDTDDVEVHRRAARAMGQFCHEHVSAALRYVDMGGGFPAHGPKPRSREAWNPRPIEEYVDAVCSELRSFMPPEPLLIVEPGRYLACDSAVFITEVVRAKKAGEGQAVSSNGAISMQPLTHYCPQIVQAYTPELNRRDSKPLATLVHGSSCREDDVLYHGLLPEVHVGDYLVHFAAGAYNSNMSPAFIFDSPLTCFF